MKLKYSDKVHGYWLDGKRCTGASSLGEILEDRRGLVDWYKRHVAYGVATNIGLQNQVVSHFDEDDRDAKIAVNGFCEQAIAMAKAGMAAHTGTAIHKTLERADAGETDLATTPTLAAAIEANRTSLEAAGLTPEPGLSEMAVVWPDDLWAGRFDRVYRMDKACPDCGRHLRVGDIKSGQNILYYPSPTVIQCCVYGRAPLWVQVPSISDWETDRLEPPPDDLCRCAAFIVAIPAGSPVGEIHVVDLDVGQQGLDLVRQVQAWRRLRNLTEPYGDSLVDTLAASIKVVEGTGATEPPAVPSTEIVGDGSREVVAPSPTDRTAIMAQAWKNATVGQEYVRKELTDRISYLSIEARRWLAARWPTDTPTLKQSDGHTPEQLAEIEALVDRTEAEYRVPFPADLGAKF